jgi:hypothetical protein
VAVYDEAYGDSKKAAALRRNTLHGRGIALLSNRATRLALPSPAANSTENHVLIRGLKPPELTVCPWQSW